MQAENRGFISINTQTFGSETTLPTIPTTFVVGLVVRSLLQGSGIGEGGASASGPLIRVINVRLPFGDGDSVSTYFPSDEHHASKILLDDRRAVVWFYALRSACSLLEA
jgi:hypothetical protein